MSQDLIYKSQGEILFRKGDPWDGLYLIKKGVVEVFDGNEESETILDTLMEGEFLGTATLFSREPRTASARAVTAIEIQHLNADVVSARFKELPQWISLIFKELITRLKRMNARVVKMEALSNHQALLNASQVCKLASISIRNLPAQKRELDSEVFLNELQDILLIHKDYAAKIMDILCQNKIIISKKDADMGRYHFPFPKLLDDFSGYCLKCVNGFHFPSKLFTAMKLITEEFKATGSEQLIWSRSDIGKLLLRERALELDISLWDSIINLPGVKPAEGLEDAIEIASASFMRMFAFEKSVQEIKLLAPVHKM